MPPKRKRAAAAKGENENEAAKKAKAVSVPLEEWRVVLTGKFSAQDALEQSLKSRGAKVTTAVSGKTTHLILGVTERNDYGKLTGVGSKKHTDAKERGLQILTEADVCAILEGRNENEVMAAATERDAPKKKPAKSAKLIDKISFIIHEGGVGAKVSLAKLKTQLSKEYDTMDFAKASTKTSLKKALDKGVKEQTLAKEGASYMLSNMVAAVAAAPNAILSVQVDPNFQRDQAEKKLLKLAPVTGRWRGLREVSRQKSKSGRAICKACGSTIAKGEKQVEVMDDSLFKMLVWPGDHHEGVSRGYVECGYGPGYETVGRTKFKLHAECCQGADEQYRTKFQRDWSKVRPLLIRDRQDEL